MCDERTHAQLFGEILGRKIVVADFASLAWLQLRHAGRNQVKGPRLGPAFAITTSKLQGILCSSQCIIMPSGKQVRVCEEVHSNRLVMGQPGLFTSPDRVLHEIYALIVASGECVRESK